GTVLLCLHQWGAHEYPSLISPDEAPPGNGLLLFFRVDDFSRALKRARTLVTRLDEEPHVNPNTQTREFSLRDPDGYYVTISALSTPRPARRRPHKRLQPTKAHGRINKSREGRPRLRGSSAKRYAETKDRNEDSEEIWRHGNGPHGGRVRSLSRHRRGSLRHPGSARGAALGIDCG